MHSFDPQNIANWTGGSWLNEAQVRLDGFCFDARQIQPGQCFVALRGGARDGHDFIEQAAQGGAVAAIVEAAKPIALPQLLVTDSLVALAAIAAAVRSQFKKPVLAITGSCGKTSTKEMLRDILGAARTHATAGNWNNRIGVPMTLFGLDSIDQDFAVIEAGINQPGEMQALGQIIQADLNVLTNIGPAHLELLGSLENVASEKSLLATCAVADSPIVLPAEALQFAAYTQLASRAIILLREGEPGPSIPVREIVRYSIHTRDGGQEVAVGGQTYRIASPSRGIATNAALAIVAARQLGIAESDICKRIEAWRPAGNRGRIESLGEQTFYVDCYNANPSSMADALEAFGRSAPQGVAHYYILGAMNELGANTVEQHAGIGRLLQLRPQDRVAFVGPEALTQAYQTGALAAGVVASQLQCVTDVEKIKSIIAPFAGAIFLKGSRGYQLEQLLPPEILNS
ncbi:UDP-N-acetylmuramoyl-tripeptide--D-alanyl-D-alanine ligase [Coraliomargarita sp. W4R72]